MTDAPRGVDVPLEWIVDPGSALPSANVFHLSPSTPGAGGVPEEVYLHVGQAKAPMVPDAVSAEQFAEMFQGRSVPVVPFAGFSLTYSRMRELADLLTRFADSFDENRGAQR